MRPALKALSPVTVGAPWMIPLLTEIATIMQGGESIATLLAHWRSNTYLIWQIERALIVTKITNDAVARELFLCGMAGRGILRNADAILADLKTIAREYSCDTIGGNVTSAGLERVYSRLGCEKRYSYWNTEV